MRKNLIFWFIFSLNFNQKVLPFSLSMTLILIGVKAIIITKMILYINAEFELLS